MLHEPHLTNTNERPRALALAAVWDRVDPLVPDLNIDPAVAGIAELPYGALGGHGFERLIYELLQTENQQPWFFARTGFPDFGVDIVTEASGRQKVYQCKNESEPPSFSAVRKAVIKFENEWLTDMSFPPPQEFLYCCTHALDDGSFDVKWVQFKDEFQKRTGVALSFLDKHALDAKLRKLPDIVAGLFSDSYAELFCVHDGWHDDPWIRLQYGTARFLNINRFLDRHKRNAIHVAEHHKDHFVSSLDQTSIVAIRGLPGLGKTFLALEMASRLRQPLRRIYYFTFKDEASVERLWKSARRRLSLPVLFVLDDCHLAPEAANTLIERLGPELGDNKLKLVLLLRDQAGGTAGQVDDTSAWVSRLEEQQVIDLRTDTSRTAAVAWQLRPDLAEVSATALAHLHNICGGDLFLLDEILKSVSTAQDVENANVDTLLAVIREHYFGGNRQLPTLTKLAALAQFDIVPRARFFDGEWQEQEEKFADPLMTRLFSPARYQFLHSSLAAIVLRALIRLDVEETELNSSIVAITTTVLRDYLQQASEIPKGPDEFSLSLKQFLRAKLSLWNPPDDVDMRSAVLTDKAIIAAIEKNLEDQSFISLALCVRWLATTENPAKALYIRFVEHRLETILENWTNGDHTNVDNIGVAFRVLREYAPATQVALLNRYGADEIWRVMFANLSLRGLFKIGPYFTSEVRNRLLEEFTPNLVSELVDRNITARRSIGALSLSIRELRETDPDFLAQFESAIGAPEFMRLILSNGTLFEFFRILQSASPDFRTALLQQLTPDQADEMINKTIALRRSIGTLNWTLRELKQGNQKLLAKLEQAVGAFNFVRLIVANGSLAEFFKNLEYATSGFRRSLLDNLTPTLATELIDKTIATHRSIGALPFAMRTLRETDPKILIRLESIIGAPRFLHLIITNGTLVDLFQILHRASLGLRAALLELLTSDQAQTLLNKTVAASHRIESFHFALGIFKNNPKQLETLETVIGIKGWWKLLIGCGTLNSLSQIIQAMDPLFRSEVIAAAADLSVSDWRGIIARGFFLNACRFVVNDLSEYPPVSRNTFHTALAKVTTSLAMRARWFDLNASRLPTEPQSDEGFILSAAFRTRLESLRVSDLFDLDFIEAVNGFACCWRECPALRSELIDSFHQIVPPRNTWPREKGSVAALRLLLIVGRSSEFPASEANWILTELTSFLDREVCDNIYTLPLFLLIWNMWALNYERGNSEEILPSALQQQLISILTRRATQKTSYQEKFALFALGGLLTFLFPNQKTKVTKSLASLGVASRWLVPIAMDATFVPAFFGLEGIALYTMRQQVFTPANCRELLMKVKEYKDIGAALENVVLHVKG